jgi:hypothetical protein
MLTHDNYRLRMIREVAKDLIKVGSFNAEFKGSPVTSMREDAQIVSLGQEQLRIGRQLLRILDRP